MKRIRNIILVLTLLSLVGSKVTYNEEWQYPVITRDYQERSNDIEITLFEVVGYNARKLNENIYNVLVEDYQEDIEVIVEGNDIVVDGAGVVDIKDKDRIDLTVRHGDLEKVYTIMIDRIDTSEKQTVIEDNEEDHEIITTGYSKKDSGSLNIMFIIMPISVVIIGILSGIATIVKKKSIKENSYPLEVEILEDDLDKTINMPLTNIIPSEEVEKLEEDKDIEVL